MSKALEQQLQDSIRRISLLEERVRSLESLNQQYKKTLKEHNVYLVHLRKANRKATKTSV
jgi:hypothetical protein